MFTQVKSSRFEFCILLEKELFFNFNPTLSTYIYKAHYAQLLDRRKIIISKQDRGNLEALPLEPKQISHHCTLFEK